ncbi:hypothetical protein IV417_02660 [Alphaproteobacteria bacterium KMM 3653]|uniref:Uncharacterized protein n=1 Tax=Harenicola maris TaxID=2841044 RepID=A0AAP2G6H3_9RHOB|nr:hypothetical protein [Harenicola maris]
MDFVELVNATCPPGIAAQVQGFRGGAAEGGRYWDLTPELGGVCGSNVLGLLAERVDARSDGVFLAAYFAQASDHVATNTAQVRERIAQAAARVDIEARPDLARGYFTALRLNRIDIREALALRPIAPMQGGEFRQLGWQYHLYLASLDTPGALAAMASHVEGIASGNDVTNLLRSLVELRRRDVRALLETYRGDQRHADGPNGPGATIAQSVAIWIDAVDWHL